MRKFFANFCIILGWIIVISFSLGALSFCIREPNRFMAGIEGALTALFIIDSIGIGLIFLGKYLKKNTIIATSKADKNVVSVLNYDLHKEVDTIKTIDNKTNNIDLRDSTKSHTPKLNIIKSIAIVTLKVFVSLLIPTVGVYMIYNSFYNHFYFHFAIYIAIYLILTIYYIYIIWRPKTFEIKDLLLLPLFLKIGLFKNWSEVMQRKYLFAFVLILITLIIVPIYYHFYLNIHSDYLEYRFCFDYYDDYDNNYYKVGMYILSAPIIMFFLYLVFAYGKQWIDEAKDMK